MCVFTLKVMFSYFVTTAVQVFLAYDSLPGLLTTILLLLSSGLDPFVD